MKEAPASRRRQFQETPLAVFTAAAVAGAGIAVARLLAWALGLPPGSPGRGAAATVGVLLCSGLLISTWHLGRPLRRAWALRRAGRSALGTEVMFALLAAAAALALLCFPAHASGVRFLWVVTSVAASGLMGSLVWVYWLPGQITWIGVPALSPIPLALLFGLVAQGTAGVPPSEFLTGWAVSLMAVDATVWTLRCIQVELRRKDGAAVQPGFMAQRRWIFALRFLLVSLPPLFMRPGAGFAVLAPMGLGILVDRLAFYSLAVRQSSEHEVAHIESILKSLPTRQLGQLGHPY